MMTDTMAWQMVPRREPRLHPTIIPTVLYRTQARKLFVCDSPHMAVDSIIGRVQKLEYPDVDGVRAVRVTWQEVDDAFHRSRLAGMPFSLMRMRTILCGDAGAAGPHIHGFILEIRKEER